MLGGKTQGINYQKRLFLMSDLIQILKGFFKIESEVTETVQKLTESGVLIGFSLG